MRHSNIILWGAIFFIFSSCIDPYYPNIGGQSGDKYVVSGIVTDQEGYQTVYVSMSSTIENPKYKPISGCNVQIIDSLGNVFDLTEYQKGCYRVWMEKKDLTPGNSYQVKVQTDTGDEIISDFDKMPECPKIDSVYYIRKDVATTNPDKPLQGIQFYIDLDGGSTNSHFFRWELTETWEHHSTYPITWFWNKKTIVQISPPDYSLFYCWTTTNLSNIYTLSTQKLTQNRYSRFKLHFVDNLTQRLTYCYSLFVTQYALSETAFNYWDNLRINSSEQGGLYETQPIAIKGNLKCTTNNKLEVLGYFSASAIRTKRIFVRNVEGLDLCYPECDPHAIERGDITSADVAYLIYISGQGLMLLEPPCVVCNLTGGGVTFKPDYWPY